jgi:hypothetical protein
VNKFDVTIILPHYHPYMIDLACICVLRIKSPFAPVRYLPEQKRDCSIDVLGN